MDFLFRVDSSKVMGAGHLQRCLTLARCLKKLGVNSSFVCRNFSGNLTALISEAGFTCNLLPVTNESWEISKSFNPPYSSWLGELWEKDFEETSHICGYANVDVLVIDHYGIDYKWESKARSIAKKILVIDDLADRRHECDYLIDQTYGRELSIYKHLVPEACVLFLGANYVLMREEFDFFREQSNGRRRNSLKHLAICFGGADSSRYVYKVLETLSTLTFTDDTEVTIFCKATDEFYSDIVNLVANFPCKVGFLSFTNSMAEFLSGCDLVIGAAGGSAWERMYLGVPSIVLLTAENQKDVFKQLSISGAVKCVTEIAEIGSLIETLQRDPTQLRYLSDLSQKLIPEAGTKKIASYLVAELISEC